MLAKYKKFFNPGLSYNVDDNEGQTSQIIESIKGKEGVSGAGIKGVSKLRARSSLDTFSKDKRYESQKVARSELSSVGEADATNGSNGLDEDLEKYFLIEDEDCTSEDDSESKSASQNKKTKLKKVKKQSKKSQSNGKRNLSEDSNYDGVNSEKEDEPTEFSFVDGGDFSQYADEDDNEEDSDSGMSADEGSQSKSTDSEGEEYESEGKDDESSEDEKEEEPMALGLENRTEEEAKGAAVTHQYELYDRIFEGRIQMQKVICKSHHLPQPDVFHQFIQKGGDEYRALLKETQSAAGELFNNLSTLQENILASNPETANVLSQSKQEGSAVSLNDFSLDDEEITSSEDEEEDQKKRSNNNKELRREGNEDGEEERRKRGRGEEDVEECLAKRHCSMKPYRQRVVSFWEERTKLLQAKVAINGGKTGSSNFSAFEENFDTVLQRLLADRDKLLRRTQLRSYHRGNLVNPIGGKLEEHKVEVDPVLDIPKTVTSNTLNERYDPEIYDDTDFYSKYLEELIKNQINRGSQKMSQAQFINFTQALKKKNKKVVDTRRSKGRKLKYDVRPALVGFAAPRPVTDQMEDEAVDKIITSLFGGKTVNVDEKV